MDNEYKFKFLKIISSKELNKKTLDFIKDMDEWYLNIEKEIFYLRTKEYTETKIYKLMNIQSNILSEIDIILSNIKLNIFKIEIIKKKI